MKINDSKSIDSPAIFSDSSTETNALSEVVCEVKPGGTESKPGGGPIGTIRDR
jgi:hypothetical protein